MRNIFLIAIALIIAGSPALYSQTPVSPKLYAHKVVVVEILKTSKYTYLNVKEQIKGVDSMQWLALPLFEPAIGDIYYFDSGLQMGEFQSKELNRTFNNITFLGGLSTSPEVSDKNIVPAPPVLAEDSTKKNTPAVVHTVVVKEVLQTRGYTYLRVKEGDKEQWVAITKLSASVGQKYTYDDAALMTNFKSQELNRTFDEILFIADLKPFVEKSNEISPYSPKAKEASDHKKQKASNNKAIKIEPPVGGIAIASLMENNKAYDGKKVKIKGEVTKFSRDILGKNWIHIEDGTSFSDKSDLIVTTDEQVKVGDVIVVEGTISLQKDYGSGYFFDVIMEEARLLSE